jgi:hypothetical protein
LAQVKEKVKRPLEGLKAGAYYGCMLLRPFDEMEFDDKERPTLFVEFHGLSAACLKEDLEWVRDICADHRSVRFDAGIGREERNRLWDARYGVRESIKVSPKFAGAYCWIGIILSGQKKFDEPWDSSAWP